MGNNVRHTGYELTPTQLAEYSVIGCLMIQATACSSVFEILTREMFETEILGRIFAEAYEAYHGDRLIDPVTIANNVGEDAKQVIFDCGQITPSVSRAEDYANIVRERWRKRVINQELILIAWDVIAEGSFAKDAIDRLQALIETQQKQEAAILDKNTRAFKECALAWLNSLGKPRNAIKTGYGLLDLITGGLQRKGLYVLSGRPGGGKSDFSLNLAARISRNHRVLYHSMEMSEEQCVEWIVSNITKIDHSKMRDGTLSEEDTAQIVAVTEKMLYSNIQINSQTGIKASDIKRKILKHHPDIVFVDNLQLMAPMNARLDEPRHLAETTKYLKQLAMKHNVVIFLLVQESREADKGGAVKLSGLKGSSATEADADAVFFVRNDKGDKFLSKDEACTAKITVSKNRHGGNGVCDFWWQPQYHSFVAKTGERE